MSCYSFGPSPSSIEYHRRKKPENNNGCGGAASKDCDSPSMALEGSVLYEIEQKRGKQTTTVTFVQGQFGRKIPVVEKKHCPTKNPKSKICSSFLYKTSR
jgi:hypothetical protein